MEYPLGGHYLTERNENLENTEQLCNYVLTVVSDLHKLYSRKSLTGATSWYLQQLKLKGLC